MADATSAMAADSDALHDNKYSRPLVPDNDISEASAKDELAVWYRYSAQLDDAWDYDRDEADRLSPLEQRPDPDESDLYDYEDLVLAYSEELSEGLSVTRHSPNSSVAVSQYSLDGNGSGSDLSEFFH